MIITEVLNLKQAITKAERLLDIQKTNFNYNIIIIIIGNSRPRFLFFNFLSVHNFSITITT